MAKDRNPCFADLHHQDLRPSEALASLGRLMTPLGPRDDHIDRFTPATRAHKAIAPIEHRRPRAVSSSHVGRVGLDLVAARLTPHDQPNASRAALPSVIGGPGRDFMSLPL